MVGIEIDSDRAEHSQVLLNDFQEQLFRQQSLPGNTQRTARSIMKRGLLHVECGDLTGLSSSKFLASRVREDSGVVVVVFGKVTLDTLSTVPVTIYFTV